MPDRPWLLTLHGLELSARKSQAIDREAEKIVTTAYREACQDAAHVQRAFERAVEAYRTRFPRIPNDVAGHAVADILSRCEAHAPAKRRGATARR
jgi:negative regulator of sigma E activity